MAFYLEKDFEDALIHKLTEIDNQWSKNVIEYKDEKYLIDNWADILYQNNNTTDRLNNCPLTETEKKQLINYVNSQNTPFLINKLLNSKYIPLKRDNPDDKLHKDSTIYLFIFDKDDIAAGRSIYQIARQPKFILPSEILGTRKGDLTLLINGLPLIHIELKRTGVPVSQAVNQIEKYSKHGVFTGMFSFVQVFIAMNPEETVYFANPGRNAPFNPDYQFHWGDFNNKHINDWMEISSTLLSIPMAHRLIGYGTISDAKDNTLKVMRSYQYHAAYKIYTRVLGRQDWEISDQKGGYVYHTTGSGKTLTSFKCAQLIASSGKVDKIVFLMDRSELWKQTFDNYKDFSDGEDIQDTDNVGILKSKLKSPDKSQLIVTSIQKMSRLINGSDLIAKSEIESIRKKKLVFIIDEAHRDVAGSMLRDIKLTYENSMFFGFTGTPIMPVNAKNGDIEFTTESLFGNVLHTYNILQGINDKNVLGFKTFKVSTFDENEIKEVVAKDKSKIDDLNNASESSYKIYQSWMLKNMIDIERELKTSIYSECESGNNHRKKVVENILKNWPVLSYRNKFHHILATSSIKEAIEYFRLLKDNDLGLNVTAVFDPHTDNATGETWKDDAVVEVLNDYNERFSTHYKVASYKSFKDDVTSKLAHTRPYEDLDNKRDEAINIVIVVNQLLTGFDSKWINVLYLDKVLEYEQYIQSCSRTNRLFRQDEKPYGIIKYYRKPHLMEENARNALKLYIETGYESVFVASLGTNLNNINKCFQEIKLLFERNNIENYSKLPSSEQDKKLFSDLFNNMNLYIERAIPELFNWNQKKYDTEDAGTVEVLLDEYTYTILKQRYSELPKSVSSDLVTYDIKPYLTEVSSDEINIAYLNSKFSQFVKDLTSGASKKDLDKILDELKSQFAILSVDDQHIADRILEDILSGDLKDFDTSKTLKDYIDIYNQNILDERIKKLCDAFGCDLKLVKTIIKYHLKEDNLNRYGRFDKIKETIDFEKAKLSLEKLDGTTIPDRKVISKSSSKIKEFILKGGFDL